MEFYPVTCELINPRKDLARIADQLYRCLKLAPCRCEWRWFSGVYGPSKECAAHLAMAAYEAITEAT